MTKHNRNGAAPTAKTSTQAPSLDTVAESYQGKRQRDFGSPTKITLSGEPLKVVNELKAKLQRDFGLKTWQAQSAVLVWILERGFANGAHKLQEIDTLLDFEYRNGAHSWCQRVGKLFGKLVLDDGTKTRPVTLKEAAKWYLKMLVMMDEDSEHISQSSYVGTVPFLRQLRAALPAEYQA